MKNLLIIVFCFILSTSIGCKTLTKKVYSLDDYIAYEISLIENISNYNDETIKVLSVIYRTNYKENNKQFNYSKINYKILNLTKSTSNITLTKNLIINTSSKNWSERIHKFEILEFFKSYNIKLANISNINIISDNGFAKTISISSHNIDYLTFANYFNLPSNFNIKINIESSLFEISGYGNSFNFDIDINDIENLASKDYDFLKIIKNI